MASQDKASHSRGSSYNRYISLKSMRNLRSWFKDASSEDIQDVIGQLEKLKVEKMREEDVLYARTYPVGNLQGGLSSPNPVSLDARITPQMIVDGLIDRLSLRSRRYRNIKVKYRFHDVDGNLCEWSGQGRLPTKLRELMEQTGKSREEFLVKDEENIPDLSATPNQIRLANSIDNVRGKAQLNELRKSYETLYPKEYENNEDVDLPAGSNLDDDASHTLYEKLYMSRDESKPAELAHDASNANDTTNAHTSVTAPDAAHASPNASAVANSHHEASGLVADDDAYDSERTPEYSNAEAYDLDSSDDAHHRVSKMGSDVSGNEHGALYGSSYNHEQPNEHRVNQAHVGKPLVSQSYASNNNLAKAYEAANSVHLPVGSSNQDGSQVGSVSSSSYNSSGYTSSLSHGVANQLVSGNLSSASRAALSSDTQPQFVNKVRTGETRRKLDDE